MRHRAAPIDKDYGEDRYGFLTWTRVLVCRYCGRPVQRWLLWWRHVT